MLQALLITALSASAFCLGYFTLAVLRKIKRESDHRKAAVAHFKK